MSSGGGGSAVPPSPTVAKSKKSKKKNAKSKANGGPAATTNGHKDEDVSARADDDTGTQEEESAAENGPEPVDTSKTTTELPLRSPKATRSRSGTATHTDATPADTSNRGEAAARLEELQKEHASLQEEAAQLRKELETSRSGQGKEADDLRVQLADTQAGKEQAEANYQALLGRVNTIKSQLGDRLREDAARIEELEETNAQLRQQDETRALELAQLAEENEAQSKELSGLRNRTTLSTQTWEREREDLVRREAEAREEFDSARQAMQDWEILAMEERSIRENLTERNAELEEQATTHREARERLEAERETQGATVDGLQRALQELQEARKRELREVVENSQTQLDNLRKELEEAKSQAEKATSSQEKTQAELERLLPLEAEIKEKNLIIGKLRHQAVGLNEHLTKALRQISRKGKAEDNISRELVTNHLLQFLGFDRTDPRKFQILQILASILEWTEEQQERAGLSRPGASNPSLRAPISPFHRTPSTPSLASADLDGKGGRVDSVGTAFAEFLEKESESGTPRSRSPSGDKK